MRTILYTILLFIFTLTIYGQDTTIVLENKWTLKGKMIKNCFVGDWTGYDSITQTNFKLKFDIKRYNENRNSPKRITQFGLLTKRLSENDSIVYDFMLENNRIYKHGNYNEYYNSPKRFYSTFYQKDVLNYQQLNFNDNKLVSIVFSKENELENYKAVTFRQNGSILTIYNYKNNKRLDNQLAFDSIGNLHFSFTLDTINKTIVTEFYQNGTIKSYGRFSNYKVCYCPDSLHIGYYVVDKNSNIIKKASSKFLKNNYGDDFLKNNTYRQLEIKDGVWLYFDTHGKILKREFFKEGELKHRYIKRLFYFLLDERN